MNTRIIEYTHGLNQAIKQDDQSFISILNLTRWVKLSLNFELLVNRIMKFLLGQRLFNNNIFCTTLIIPYPRNDQEK